MMLNMKMLLVLVLAMMSFVTSSPGSVRKLEEEDNAPAAITLKHLKAKDSEFDEELDVEVKLMTCKKDNKKCKKMRKKAKKVSQGKFASILTGDMMDVLDRDEDDDDRRALKEYCGYIYFCNVYDDCFFLGGCIEI